jgi:hypothetical protein
MQTIQTRWISEDISCLLLNPKVYYCVQGSSILVSILSQINPVHSFSSY